MFIVIHFILFLKCPHALHPTFLLAKLPLCPPYSVSDQIYDPYSSYDTELNSKMYWISYSAWACTFASKYKGPMAEASYHTKLIYLC